MHGKPSTASRNFERKPLEHIDHRPRHNLQEPLTMRHESSQKRYTMALAGTAGLALSAWALALQTLNPKNLKKTGSKIGAIWEQAQQFGLWRRISA